MNIDSSDSDSSLSGQEDEDSSHYHIEMECTDLDVLNPKEFEIYNVMIFLTISDYRFSQEPNLVVPLFSKMIRSLSK